MATTKADFFRPEMWSEELIKIMQADLVSKIRPKRDNATQALRDAALGHPEYPETPDMTATQIRIKHEMLQHQADAAAYAMSQSIDADILTSVRDRKR